MKIEELRQKNRSELEGLLQEHLEVLRTFRFHLSVSTLTNVRDIRKERLLVARIQTVLAEKFAS